MRKNIVYLTKMIIMNLIMSKQSGKSKLRNNTTGLDSLRSVAGWWW